MNFKGKNKYFTYSNLIFLIDNNNIYFFLLDLHLIITKLIYIYEITHEY